MKKLDKKSYLCKLDETGLPDNTVVADAFIAAAMNFGEVVIKARNGNGESFVHSTSDLDAKIDYFNVKCTRTDGMEVEMTRYVRPKSRDGLLYDPVPMTLMLTVKYPDSMVVGANEVMERVSRVVDQAMYKTKHI